MARLRDPKSGVSISIIPGGISNQQESLRLVSLGTLFYEPLWVFSRGELLTKHEQLRSLRISIGPEGSASRALSLEFLARVGIIDQKSATLLPQTPQESAAKLLNGDIDAAILVDAWETPLQLEVLAECLFDITFVDSTGLSRYFHDFFYFAAMCWEVRGRFPAL
jgi:TRAP-type uncharacterized transport system substrate-binding protein